MICKSSGASGLNIVTCCSLVRAELAADSSPQPLNEISIEQTEAKASESCKDAIAERHDCQQLHISLKQGFGIGFGDSKDGC